MYSDGAPGPPRSLLALYCSIPFNPLRCNLQCIHNASPMLVNVACSTQACGLLSASYFRDFQRASANADTRLRMQGIVRERV